MKFSLRNVLSYIILEKNQIILEKKIQVFKQSLL